MLLMHRLKFCKSTFSSFYLFVGYDDRLSFRLICIVLKALQALPGCPEVKLGQI
jgi:hypothetical protein